MTELKLNWPQPFYVHPLVSRQRHSSILGSAELFKGGAWTAYLIWRHCPLCCVGATWRTAESFSYRISYIQQYVCLLLVLITNIAWAPNLWLSLMHLCEHTCAHALIPLVLSLMHARKHILSNTWPMSITEKKKKKKSTYPSLLRVTKNPRPCAPEDRMGCKTTQINTMKNINYHKNISPYLGP